MAKVIKIYDYTDEVGVLLYQNVRYEPKDFRQRRPDGNGGWIWNLNGTRRVPYRLQELLRANPDQLVFIVEGEKDVDRLYDEGLIATTAGAANNWRDELAEFFSDRKVCILPDNDKPGRDLAERIAETLRKARCSEYRILYLPGLPDKGDVSDFLDNGGTREELLTLANTEPAQKKQQAQSTTEPTTEQPTNGFNLTDAGNAERFASQHGDKIRYCWSWGKWLYYDGQRWNIDTGFEVANRLAVKTARSILQEANGKDHERRGQILKWSYLSEGNARLTAMLQIARAFEPIAIYAKDFDTDPWLFNCTNGVIDLRTGKLRDHEPGNMLTKLAPVVYDPDAKLELWDNFLSTATDNDEGLIEFLQRATGYSATGDTSEEKLFFIHGPTATGKSTFLEAVKATLGDYAQTSDFETFLQRKQVGGIRNDIAKLAGARMVVSIEVEQGKRLAEGMVKMLTGGDTVSARFLYKESFEFMPQFTLWLAANAAPKIRDDDAAMWRRILRVPFEHSIPKDQQDPEVKTTLKNHKVAGPAILAWIVKGCLAWQKDRLKVPEVIEKSTEEYRQSQNPLRDFFEDACQFGPEFYVLVSEMRTAYERWANEVGIAPKYQLGRTEFNKRLRAKECQDQSKRYNNEMGTEKVGRCWLGVTTKENPQSDQNQGGVEENQSEIPF